jgi:hypothetical protein
MPILLGSWNLNPTGREEWLKNLVGSSPITAHGVRALSHPVASSVSKMDEVVKQLGTGKLTVMSQEI